MAKRFSVVTALLAALAGAAVANADADPPAPQLGAACSPELADTMTLLPDEQTYAVCSESEPWTSGQLSRHRSSPVTAGSAMGRP